MARINARLEAGPADAAEQQVDFSDPFADPSPGGAETGGAFASHPDEGDWSGVRRPIASRPAAGAFRPDPAPEADRPPRFKPVRLTGGPTDRIAAVTATLGDPTRVAVVQYDPFGEKAA